MRWTRFLFVFVLLTLLLSVSVSLVVAQEGNQTGRPVVTERIVASPSFEDKDWPIIRVERLETKDPKTGLVYFHQSVIRQGPAEARPAPNSTPCSDNKVAPLAASCYYLGPSSQTDTDGHLGGVVAHLVHYLDHWCENQYFCDLWKPYKLEVWWTRSDSNWDARNATTQWGCIGCTIPCDGGGQWSWTYTRGPFDPIWTGNISSIYQYTSDTFPRLRSNNPGSLQGRNDSSGYHWGSYVGDMHVVGSK